MITLSTFQEHLSSKVPLALPSGRNFDGQEQQLLKWAALLPLKTEAQQAEQLEKIFAELAVADLEDKLRLKLISIVITASDRLIATLRKNYIYETGSFTASQLSDMAQVKSLYYSSILVYDSIIRRESFPLDSPLQYAPSNNQWKRYFTFAKTQPFILAVAIYQSLLIYQKLLNESAISYQKPPASLWSALNQLYYLASQRDLSDIDLSSALITRHADNIHQLYCQICLHSLLNVRAMRRSSILQVQRLLPEWSEHITATIDPQTGTRIFIDVRSDHPPTYLTPYSTINPYDEQHDCLFIELASLVSHLQARTQILADDSNNTVEYCLVTKVLMAITYRYIQPQLTIPTKYSPKQYATVVTGFNDIHYHVAGAQSLMSLIAVQKLSHDQHPRYDTSPHKHAVSKVLEVEVFDGTDISSHFRMLRLLPIADKVNVPVSKQGKSSLPSACLKTNSDQQAEAAKSTDNDHFTTAPPSLRLMNLFLLCRSDTDSTKPIKPSWSMGIVRWLDLDNQSIDNQKTNSQKANGQSSDNQNSDNQTSQVEWQIIGDQVTACAIRLDDRNTARSQHFVQALIVGGYEQLQTVSSLLLPAYHFQVNDRVMMRIGDKQEPLRLQRLLLSTEGFNQYEVVRL